MLGIERIIIDAGGIASTGELVRGGYPHELIRVFGSYGVVVNVSHGWWALPGLAAAVGLARQLGGRLACVSALEYHGQLTVGSSDDIQGHYGLHIALGRSAKRPHGVDVTVHWSRRRLDGDRQAVSAEVAWEQART